MDDAEKEQIRTRTDIVELISAYTALKKAGNKYKGLCPFHQEKTPSFVVDPERGRWRCFGACGIGGDAFSFLEKAENLSFREAMERLAGRAGIILATNGMDREEARRLQSEKDRVYEVNALAARFFRNCFQRDRLAQDYANRRGLAHETREAFLVGYAPDDWSQLSDFLLRQKVHAEDAVKAGLITPSRRGDGTFTDRFRGRLIFPIVDVQERVVAFGGRLIVDKPDAPKYLNSPETPVFSKSKTLYALNRGKRAISDRKMAVVVEGYMDAVAAHQAGIAFVVATLGTALTDEHIRLLRRYTGEGGAVLLSFDADNAGVRAALKAAELIAGSAPDLALRVLALPPGEDPDSMITKGDVAGFHRAIDNSLAVPEFRLQSILRQHDVNTQAGRQAFFREAVAVIASVPTRSEMDGLISKWARYQPGFEQSGYHAEEVFRAEVNRVRKGNGGPEDFPDDPLSGSVPPPQRRGGPTGYGREPRAYGSGNGAPSGGGGNGRYERRGGSYNGKYGGKSGIPYVHQDNLAAPAKRSATEEAERTLLRACLSDEWLPVLRRVTGDRLPPAFVDQGVHALLEALWPLVKGKYAPNDALAQLSDELIAYADGILMDESGPELTERVIGDAVMRVALGQTEARARDIVRPDSGEVTNEQLQQWFQQKRLNPRRRIANSDEDL